MQHANTLKLALDAFHKHKAVRGSYDEYPGIVSMHGMARIATETGDKAYIEEIRGELMPYVRGERSYNCNFPNYFCGGNASAWMLYKGLLPEVKETAVKYCEQIRNEAPRDPDGILCHPKMPSQNAIWIDVAFAVSPFLLFTGLTVGNDEYVEDAINQTVKMIRQFYFEKTGLIFQCKNFRWPGHMSEDHWSRSNGWGALALCELAVHLPDSHPRKQEVTELYLRHMMACLKYQDENGMWHQEMTQIRTSYVETSGTSLLLYALGAGIHAGIVPESELPHFEKGLKGMLAYISTDTDIYHTCCGCLCPGQGTKLEYAAHPTMANDFHAFGPVVLAMGQAHFMGIENI